MFKIVSSSAGSGKTYTLTKEYLKLALHSDNSWYFKHILAITFTKAATREMKERIVSRLKTFADPTLTDTMLTDIVTELYPEAVHDNAGAFEARTQIIRRRASLLFANILHNYSDFSVMTIDSFVQRLVSAFTEELGIPFSFEVEMESSELLMISVERLLEKAGDDTQKELTQILESFYTDASEEGQNWHKLPETLAKFAYDLLSEERYAAIQKNQKLKTADFKKIRQHVQAFTKTTEALVINLAKRAKSAIDFAGVTQEDFSYGTVPKYFQKRQSADKIFEPLGKRETDAFLEDNGWYKKDARTFVRDSIDGIKVELCEVFSDMEAIKEQREALYILYQQLLPTLYQMSLLNEIKAEFDAQLRDNGRVHISEFNQKILKIVTEDPVPFIYERLGEKYFHILIDEFQDTSKLQFANLLPLIDNSLSYEYFNLAVGDSKQAIYRFRGGDMDQIVALHSRKLGRLMESLGQSELTAERLQNIQYWLKPDALNTNRRSARAIIEFNNDFFEHIAGQISEQFTGVADVFDANFKQLVPAHARQDGHVQFEFIDTKTTQDNDDDAAPAMLDRTWTLIQEIEAEGYGWNDIAILCRRVSEAKMIANFLKNKGYNILSEDSLSLRFSEAVNLLTAFMRVLIRPDDRLKKYEAMYLFYQNILHKTPDNEANAAIKIAVESNDVRHFYSYINQYLMSGSESFKALNPYKLLQLSVYELAEQLILTFGLFEQPQERDYLFRFLDVILEYGSNRGSHLADFLDYWQVRQDKISISSPADTRAITIQTIHKAKGLEYPIVIIPYTNWSYTPNALRDVLWVNVEKSPETTLMPYEDNAGNVVDERHLQTAPLKMKSTLTQAPKNIAKQYHTELERVFMDNLNLLYVAFTRPTDRLYVLAKKDKFETLKTPNRVSYWLYQYVLQKQLWDESRDVYQLSERATESLPKRESGHANEAENLFKISKVISNDRSRDMRLRRMADRVFDVETFERKKDHGNKVHYALSMVRSAEDIETAIRKLQLEGIVEAEEGKEIKLSIEKILQHPELSGLFEVDTSVLNEREILTPDGKLHRPDRVVRLADRVVILDYKTGKPSESHQTQLRRYVKLYHQMGHKNVEGKLVYLEQNEVHTL